MIYGVCITAARWAPLRRIPVVHQVAQAYSTLRPRPNLREVQGIRQASRAALVDERDVESRSDRITLESSQSQPVFARISSMPEILPAETCSIKGNPSEDMSENSKLKDTESPSIITSSTEINHWTDYQRQLFAKRISDFDSLERCLVWITQQGLRFEVDPAPPWLLLCIFRLPAQVNTLLDLCHTVIPRIPQFDDTTRNSLIALLIHRFADHGMMNAVEPIYQLRRKTRDGNTAEDTTSTSKNTSELDDQGELAILRALQRLVSVMGTDKKGSEAKIVAARKLLGVHVKQIVGAKARLLSADMLDSLYREKYLTKPLVRALETVRKRKKIELDVKWARTLFRFAIRRKDDASAHKLLDELKTHLAADDKQSVRNMVFHTLLQSLRHLDPSSDLYRDIRSIQHQYPTEDPNAHEKAITTARQIARTHRLTTSAFSNQITSAEWQQICRDAVEDTVDLRSLTVMMEGFLSRGQPGAAWRLWQRFYTDVVLDIIIITTVVKVLAKLYKVEEAIQLVNACTRLPTRLVDKRAVNELLRICAESGRLDYVQRIWEEMEARWQVRPDEVTLGTLVYATQINPEAPNASFAHLVKRSFFSETADLNLYETNSQDPEPEHDTDSTKDLGSQQDGEWWHSPSEAGMWLNWKSARALFRHILFRNHPFLINVRSPLQGGFASGLSNMVFGQRQERRPQRGSDEITQTLTQLPIYSRHYDITYTQHTFHSFICLLNKHNLGDEMALCLGWMKRLRIQPQQKTLSLILLKVEESSSPKQMRHRSGVEGWKGYALMTDGEWLKEWLIDWLGKNAVPSEEELGDFHMHRRNDK
ncbi:hypothetical protein QFC22_002615 [Naganishia vaughanmartiniae]|uniref:Uncharacterized protein n=1 Tax=Naganishia vaughanmartiniae TaxID=1424756 RepID=A0ACC2X9I7_9TREE|nr:hypothetical protein QFC22_002615 [Naganishia vaughanmartiniae]